MNLLLAAAVDSVSWCTTAEVLKFGKRVSFDRADVDGWTVVGFAELLSVHPCGVRTATPPVIVEFESRQWRRIERHLARLELLDEVDR